jgi:hypothetical protein
VHLVRGGWNCTRLREIVGGLELARICHTAQADELLMAVSYVASGDRTRGTFFAVLYCCGPPRLKLSARLTANSQPTDG